MEDILKKKSIIISLLVVFSVGLIVVSVVTKRHTGTEWKESSDTIDYYPLAVGNTWNYIIRDAEGKTWEYNQTVIGKETISGVSAWVIEERKEAVCVGKSWIEKTPTAIRWYRFTGGDRKEPKQIFILNPPMIIHKLPFRLGDVSVASSKITAIPVKMEEDKTVDKYNLKTIIESKESITTPMATFVDCMKVRFSLSFNNTEIISYRWFAPNVGVVKTEDLQGATCLLTNYNIK